MKYTLSRDAHGHTVRMQGRLLHKDFSQINQLLGEIKQAGGQGLVVDLSGVEFIDSGGIGLLLLLRDQLKYAITLRGATGQPANLLQNAHMDELFQMG